MMTKSVVILEMSTMRLTYNILFQQVLHNLNDIQFVSKWMRNPMQYMFAHKLL